MSVAVVTDSTADLPRELVESIGLRMVPLSVTFGTETHIAGVTLTTEQFYARMATADEIPTTSQPAPAWFEEAYADCRDAGHDAVVSLHCSSALSGTVSLARHRARLADIDVEVVDSRLVGGALGLAVLAAHRVAENGGSVDEVVAAARRVHATSRSYIVVDQLDHLRRGGRLSGSQAAIGSALKVKPLLTLTSRGTVEVHERTRTWTKASARLVELVAQSAAGREVNMVLVDAVAADRAAALRDQLLERVEVRELIAAPIGPIVGTHVGAGAVGVAVCPV